MVVAINGNEMKTCKYSIEKSVTLARPLQVYTDCGNYAVAADCQVRLYFLWLLPAASASAGAGSCRFFLHCCSIEAQLADNKIHFQFSSRRIASVILFLLEMCIADSSEAVLNPFSLSVCLFASPSRPNLGTCT
jgi:hypothetical protein